MPASAAAYACLESSSFCVNAMSGWTAAKLAATSSPPTISTPISVTVVKPC